MHKVSIFPSRPQIQPNIKTQIPLCKLFYAKNPPIIDTTAAANKAKEADEVESDGDAAPVVLSGLV